MMMLSVNSFPFQRAQSTAHSLPVKQILVSSLSQDAAFECINWVPLLIAGCPLHHSIYLERQQWDLLKFSFTF